MWISEAAKLINTPFEWHGRSLAGIDCLGLVLVPLWAAGKVPRDFDFRDYGNHPQNMISELRGRGAAYLQEIASPVVGGVIAYPIKGLVAHLAWLETETTILHAHYADGVCRDYREDWLKREAGAVFFEVI